MSPHDYSIQRRDIYRKHNFNVGHSRVFLDITCFFVRHVLKPETGRDETTETSATKRNKSNEILQRNSLISMSSFNFHRVVTTQEAGKNTCYCLRALDSHFFFRILSHFSGFVFSVSVVSFRFGVSLLFRFAILGFVHAFLSHLTC